MNEFKKEFEDLMMYLNISKDFNNTEFYMNLFNTTKREMKMMENEEIINKLNRNGFNVEKKESEGLIEYKISW